MLHYETIDQPTLALLKKLQAAAEFASLRLVGGTALALQIGHRKSVDIDLFGQLDSDEIQVSAILNTCGKVTTLSKSQNIGVYFIDGIKVDIVNYPYPWLNDAVSQDGLLLAGKQDIAAMKLAAITNRGSKKDFIDIYFLFKQFTLNEMLAFYREKYQDGAEFLVLKSLTYFDDAENEPFPVMLQPVAWEQVKQIITEAVENCC
ncbi:MAG: nucleotidyl transferase AbiEii/AbiGii toxin family protein [Lentisphaeria bacterium]|nr:nucleotidyl transferase AbiEii/AbiGii toxin family protein [Lentisphaeria bacterium]